MRREKGGEREGGEGGGGERDREEEEGKRGERERRWRGRERVRKVKEGVCGYTLLFTRTFPLCVPLHAFYLSKRFCSLFLKACT